MRKLIRTSIVDDERLARERLKRLLRSQSDIKLQHVLADGQTAFKALCDEPPELLFLDVHMPGRDGFGVAEGLRDRLSPAELPLIVFVTAYDEHALRAFEAEALDYLVKPFDDARFTTTLSRVRQRVQERRLGGATAPLRTLLGMASGAAGIHQTEAATNTLEPAAGPLERIVVRSGDRARLLPAEQVDWVEADGVYARLHVGSESFLLRAAMHDLEARLDPRRFARIHRSTIVNLDRVRELHEIWRGEYELLLQDGTRLKLSRSRKAHLESLLGQSL